MKSTRTIAVIAVSMCFTTIAQEILQLNLAQDKSHDAHNGKAVISGRGEALPDGYSVSLYVWDNEFGESIATDTIADGKFRIEVPVDEELIVGSIYVNNSRILSMHHMLYLTPGAEVEIGADSQFMYTWDVKSNVPEQSDYELFINNSKDLWIEYQKDMLDYYNFKSPLNYDEFEQRRDSIRMLITHRDLELLKTLPVGTVWLDMAYKLTRYYPSISEDMKTLYATLEDSVKNSPKGREIRNYLYSGTPVGIGDKFPDADFFDLEGNIHHFSEFRGKWCLVDFWNAGCAPCLRALPELRELKKEYPEMLELVSLSMDTESKWQEISKKLPLIGNNWNEGKEYYGVYRRLGINAFPTFLLVAPNGTIQDIWRGYDTGELKQKMSVYLKPEDKTECSELN